eukprot:CAMPEP_0116862406 /NCGR_PEP_ID=MMETSP0418-20121206/23618_1 /TAXON_ID=1158023 /ORGANISM="Astrosyne radiata, Strain 13vi08-1A" /LENGTH=404 /DNA_ID=CAMNT_0004497251 /DNA_START=619 /DNA_END=1836 /DNA_ORIENTATION=-
MVVNQNNKRMDTKFQQAFHCLDFNAIEALPKLDREDLIMGKFVGWGGYSHVHELLGLCNSPSHPQLIAKNKRQLQQKFPPLVVKELSPDILAGSPRKQENGTADLIMEGYILASLQHPNILSVRGLSRRTDATSAFLVLDRLHETLDHRIKRWKKRSRTYSHIKTSLFAGQLQKQFVKRLAVACDIANTLCYLHDQNIVYRDLKPCNLGFDKEGNIRLFDFGLARPLPKDRHTVQDHRNHEEKKEEDHYFDMSGNAGTLRYMSPEVFRCERYGLKADVYSFSLLVWEILAMQKPFSAHKQPAHIQKVVGEGERPPLEDASWPREIRSLLQSGWSQDPAERPSMREFHAVLTKQLAELQKPKRTKPGIKRPFTSVRVEVSQELHLQQLDGGAKTNARHNIGTICQ